jgi:hypothetical protein
MSWRPCDRSIVGAENSQAGHLARRQSRRLVEQALAVAAPTAPARAGSRRKGGGAGRAWPPLKRWRRRLAPTASSVRPGWIS